MRTCLLFPFPKQSILHAHIQIYMNIDTCLVVEMGASILSPTLDDTEQNHLLQKLEKDERLVPALMIIGAACWYHYALS